MRYLGMFLADPVSAPAGLVAYLAEQLEIAGAGCLGEYTVRHTTRFEHQAEIVTDTACSPSPTPKPNSPPGSPIRPGSPATARKRSSTARSRGAGAAGPAARGDQAGRHRPRGRRASAAHPAGQPTTPPDATALLGLWRYRPGPRRGSASWVGCAEGCSPVLERGC